MDHRTPDGATGLQLDERKTAYILVISHRAAILADKAKADPVIFSGLVVDMHVAGEYGAGIRAGIELALHLKAELTDIYVLDIAHDG